jgi:hypothetical protein
MRRIGEWDLVRVLTLKQAAQFLREELGMDVSHAWVRKMAEPDGQGRRRLPFFKQGDGKTTPLITTDEALRAYYRERAEAALRQAA